MDRKCIYICLALEIYYKVKFLKYLYLITNFNVVRNIAYYIIVTFNQE